jgi:hypothetical protein
MTTEEGNKIIADFMEDEAEVEYYVGNEDSICYSPKNVGSHFSWPASQKQEAERWLREQKEKYPDGWVTKDGFCVQRIENYPRYNSSWDWLMPACHKWDSLTDADIIEGTWYQYEELCEILDAKVSLYEILPVWEQLVKNIEWYNQSKNTQS